MGNRVEAGVELEIEAGIDSAELKTGAGVEIVVALIGVGSRI